MNLPPSARRLGLALALVLAAVLAVAGTAGTASAASPVDAKIEIVWPPQQRPRSTSPIRST